jgi:hypothetical protein
MLDDFFQYAAELQQSLEEQGALHGCSARQHFLEHKRRFPYMLCSTYADCFDPCSLVFVLCRCVHRRQQQELVAAGKRQRQQQQQQQQQ